MKRLIVDNGDIQRIAAELGCNRNTVSLALKWASSTVKAREIRGLAIAKYNARMVKEVELTPKEMLDGMACE